MHKLTFKKKREKTVTLNGVASSCELKLPTV